MSDMQETPRGNTPYDSVGTGFRFYGTVNVRDPHYPYCYSGRSSELRLSEKKVDAILRAARKPRERDLSLVPSDRRYRLHEGGFDRRISQIREYGSVRKSESSFLSLEVTTFPSRRTRRDRVFPCGLE